MYQIITPYPMPKSGIRIPVHYYKDNYRREGIRVANARPKVIIFCKSNWDLVSFSDSML